MDQTFLLIALIAIVSLCYAMVAQAGGTAFLGVMALASIPATSMRPVALLLNIVAAAYGTWQLHRRGAIERRALLLVTIPSLGAAFVGGLIKLDNEVYFKCTGLLLLIAAALLAFRKAIATSEPLPFPFYAAAMIGAGTGLLSGLTGVGGGTFLAPLLILFGWASAKRAAAISPPFIFCNSILGLTGVLLSGQELPSGTPVYAAAALTGAIVGTKIGYHWMSERSIRYVLVAILLLGGLRLMLR